MKFVAISDTHGQHSSLQLPEGDVLLHAGDVSRRGTQYEILQFIHWFAELPYKHKIFIAGNHDFYLEDAPNTLIQNQLPKDVHYLNDSGILIEGIRIWGSPITPYFHNWAFNRHSGEEIQKHWDLIPSNTEILITHGPVYGILDETSRFQKVGCVQLRAKVAAVQPKFHLFGHIHEAYGCIVQNGTTFINASVLDDCYEMSNQPVLFEY